MTRRWVPAATFERYQYVVWDEQGPLADWLNGHAEKGYRLVSMTEAPVYSETTQTVVMERVLSLEVEV